MKTLLTILFFAFTGSVAIAQQIPTALSAQDRTPNQIAAEAELAEAAKAYKSGKFAEAQRHSEAAIALDPGSQRALIFAARSTHAQYRPGVETPANRDIALAAIAAYQRMLNADPRNVEAQKAIGALYGQLKELELLRQWMIQIATNPLNDAEFRVENYQKLAQAKLDESEASVTLLLAHAEKQGVESAGRAQISVEDRGQYNLAFQATNEALQMAEAAIYVDGAAFRMWRLKAVILERLASLLEADGRKDEQSEYTAQAGAAAQRANELEAQQKPSN